MSGYCTFGNKSIRQQTSHGMIGALGSSSKPVYVITDLRLLSAYQRLTIPCGPWVYRS